MDVSSAHFEEDEVLGEDANLSLVVEPLALSLPLAMEDQEDVGVDSSVRQEPYSKWFQSKFNDFDSFPGTSLEGLENQETNFLLAVEAELKQRAALNKKASDLWSIWREGGREEE